MKILELKEGQSVNIEFAITEQINDRKFCTCYKCFARTTIALDKYEGKCPKCGEKECKEARRGCWTQDLTTWKISDNSGEAYLDLWNEDAHAYKVGDKIQLIEGYFKVKEGMKFVQKGRSGTIR